MRLFRYLLPVLIVLGTGATVIAQHAWCGTTVEDQIELKERMFQNRENFPAVAQTRGAITYVRVQPQIVRQSDGTGGISESTVLESICIMNEFYNQIDVHFYLAEQGFKYIDNSNAYSDPGGNSSFLRQRRVRDAMNIFYTGDIADNGPGITQAFYNRLFDYIVCDNTFALRKNVLSHEVGHFFTLSHPFLGWEPEPWDEDLHGLAVGPNSPNGVPNEKQDGSNCQTAGDGICDTPPDYLFAFHPSQNNSCVNWEGGAMDPDSVVVDPMEVNLMSYFEPCVTYELTDGQKTEVLRDLGTANRAGLRNTIPTNLEPVTDLVTNISPVADEVVDGYENINLTWSTVPKAEWYMLEVDRSIFNFNSDNLVRIITKDTTATVQLTRRRSWEYRVKAYNAAFPCSEFNEAVIFRTGENPTTSVRTIEALNDWRVVPNPVQLGRNINLQVNASEAFEATIKVYDLVGKQVLLRQHTFGSGNTSTNLSIGELAQGMYIVQLESERGIATQKLIVNK